MFIGKNITSHQQIYDLLWFAGALVNSLSCMIGKGRLMTLMGIFQPRNARSWRDLGDTLMAKNPALGFIQKLAIFSYTLLNYLLTLQYQLFSHNLDHQWTVGLSTANGATPSQEYQMILLLQQKSRPWMFHERIQVMDPEVNWKHVQHQIWKKVWNIVRLCNKIWSLTINS